MNAVRNELFRSGVRQRVNGFTLMEMLIALVITGLLVALLSGSLYYALQTREKMSTELERGREGLGLQSLFRAVIGGCIPMAGGEESFIGDSRQISMLTTTPLLPSKLRGPELVVFRLVSTNVDSGELIYIERGKEYILATWRNAEMKFRYVDELGKVTSEWSVDPQSRTRLLPRLVRLEIRTGEKEELYLAAPRMTDWLEVVPKPPFDVELEER